MNRVLRTLLYVLYELIFIGTVFLMLGYQTVARVNTSKDFPIENAGFLIIGLIIIVLLFFINDKLGNKIDQFLKKYSRILLPVTLGFLLFWQLYTSYGGYFYSGWDAGGIRKTVIAELNGNYQDIDIVYYSCYPNNLLIIWLFMILTRFALTCGLQHPEFAPVIFQCFLDVLTMFLIYRITFDLSKSRRLTWLTYLTAYLFIGISPWFIVAYSDATGIVFPVLLIRLYQLSMKFDKRWFKNICFLLLGFIAILAYHIKPQTIIVLIAITLIELVSLFKKWFFREIIRALPSVVACAAGMAIAFTVNQVYIVPSLHMDLNPESTVSWPHFIMMGLNNNTDGVYASEDISFSQSFTTNDERNAADLQEAENRLKAYGTKGIIRHLCRKQLVNYGDGTFAWNVEGNSFDGDPEWAQNGISNWIRSYIEPDGAHYVRFISSKQLFWVVIVFFQLFVIFYRPRTIYDNNDKMMMIMITSVIGLTIFELLFEARARYLFCFAPVYVILSCAGLKNVDSFFKRHCSCKALDSERKA